MVQTTLYVNPAAGNDSGSGHSSSPFKTLTKALQSVTAPTTIRLAPGTYQAAGGEKFPLVIPSGVIVVGQEANKGKGIVIVGSGTYASPSFGDQNITLRLNSYAQLRGVTLSNQAKNGTGVWIESAQPIIANNTFTHCTREGVFVTGTGKPMILDNVFIGKDYGGSGIFLVRNAKGEVRRNLCQTSGYGIAVTDWAAPLISDNKLVGNSAGISLSLQARAVLRRNLIERNTNVGMILTDDAQPDFGNSQDPAGNIVRRNRKLDLKNDSGTQLVSVGNQLNPARVSGAVSFPYSKVPATLIGPNQFSDLGGHWAEAFVQKLVQKGLIRGFPDGTFRPEDKLNRAQYAAIIAKSFDLPRQVGTGAGVFSDVPGGFWAAEAIRTAASMGFISGFPDRTFRPQQNLTRLQALMSLVSGLGLNGGNPNLLRFYSDRAQIPSYATEALATATQKELVVNYPQVNQLNPMLPITRAEIASLIYQALVATEKAETIASAYIVKPDPDLPSFSDIQQHWAADFVASLSSQELVSGFTDGSFKPDTPMNRAQYAALIVKVFNPNARRPAKQFIDVPSNFWASTVISQAYRGGFLSGFPDQTFRPQQRLRRINLITSLVSGLSLPRVEKQGLTTKEVLAKYEDRDKIPEYAQAAVAAATIAGLIVSYPETKLLQPIKEATRAEATAFVYQALVNKGHVSAIDSAYIVSTTPS
ncbi:MAG: DUF1565 domain-containing protein [Symploca sp. SIO2E9]|nr:DUF1565 domain-containing protein [Symploca sp. SIO2E9]